MNIETGKSAEASKGGRDFWKTPISGEIDMDQDPDKMFHGDKIKVSGVVRIWKAGPVCFMDDMELDIGAGVDGDDYYDVEA